MTRCESPHAVGTLGTVAVTAPSPAVARSAASAGDRVAPNILLIVSEDTGTQLSCYDDPVVKTPHLDVLASRGVRFEAAYVTQAGCSSSRASIFTGLYPHQNGQIGLATHKFRMFRGDYPNLPSLLRANGYRTGVIGKIHVNPEETFEWDFKERPKYNLFGHRDVAKVADLAASFIGADDARPFFLMVNYSDTHKPFLRQDAGLPARPFGPGDVKTLPFVGHDSPETLQTVADYYNCVSRLDTGCGMLLDCLDRAGKTDNTLVIYLGDHGPELARGKMTCYEGGVRVPFVLSFPGRIPPGTADNYLVSMIDLLPTILDAARIQPPPNLPGQSLLPLLDGRSSSWRQYLFTEFTVHMPSAYYPSRTVRDERYKLIHNLLWRRPNPIYRHYLVDRLPPHLTPEDIESAPSQVRRTYNIFRQPPQFELYDLQTDPWEFDNLSDDPAYGGVLERLRGALDRWQEETNDALRHPAMLDRLTTEIESVYSFDKHEYEGVNYKKEGFEWEYSGYFLETQPGGKRDKGE